MRSWIFIALLGSIAAVDQCDLSRRNKDELPFPNVEDEGVESYQISVEYTAYGAKQTDYYTEYYDILYGRGRVDSHQAGESFTYVYRTASWEAWEISKENCTLQNITDTPKFYRDDVTDWTYDPPDKPGKRTVGPSAMFKVAYDIWNSDEKNTTMAYMGIYGGKVRGLNAHYWRRCDTEKSYVDYFFTADRDENPFGLPSLKRLPLRVLFAGTREGKAAEMSEQQYDIMSFQPYINLDIRPFELPIGKGCARGIVDDAPDIPDFLNKNLQFQAEVVYRTINRTDGEPTQYWSYYSTLFLALDLSSQYLAFHTTPWTITKEGEPDAGSPIYTIFDSKHGYLFKTKLDTGKCEIDRQRNFIPEYELPNDAGSISLTDPSILFPNSEFTYISEGRIRGLRVNIFEEIVENYTLSKGAGYEAIPKAVVTHAYLQDDVVERNTVSVKNSLAQVQLRFTGRNNIIEILTFNFFGFTTELRNRRRTFDTSRCFKNDDDYVWVTIGFNADKDKILKVIHDVPSIQANMLNAVTLKTELTPVRIPIIEVDVKNGIFVTMKILGKPPVTLDYMEPDEGMTVLETKIVEGVEDLDSCATRCLETEDNCWGFSKCGGVCYFGTPDSAKVGNQTGCKLYKRYDLDQYIPSKEKVVENLRSLVEENDGFSLLLRDKDDKMVQIDPSSIEVTYPGEDDRIFNRIGNTLNPRMRVVKAGFKLLPTAGSQIMNMGKLRYDECQRLCLDFKDCETASYCITDSACLITTKYGDKLKDGDMKADNMCNLIARKYADHFDRSPGIVLTKTAQVVLNVATVEECARECLTQTKFKCLSFDHCPADDPVACNLHTVHYPNANTREAISKKSTNCGHYFRRYSTEFKKTAETRVVGSKVPPLSNMTLEECSKSCMEYGKGTCFGFDFCQGSSMLATSCILLDSDPSQMKKTYSPICVNYLRTESQYAPRPYSSSYAGGIGFLCFLIGGIMGAVIIFGIAYMRVNRQR